MSRFIALLISFFSFQVFANDPTLNEVENILRANHLPRIIELYRTGEMVVDSKNTTPNKLVLANSRIPADPEFLEAADAQDWFRAVQIAEFNSMNGFQVACIENNSFCGIAPNITYVKGFLTNRRPGVVIQFRSPAKGWLYNRLTTQGRCQVKAEGGGTYGLGQKGIWRSCAGELKVPGGPGRAFNAYIVGNEIVANVAYVLVPRK